MKLQNEKIGDDLLDLLKWQQLKMYIMFIYGNQKDEFV